MSECPHCEYNKKRAQNWRVEAYRLAGHPLPEREWVGLNNDDWIHIYNHADKSVGRAVELAEAKLKEKNT